MDKPATHPASGRGVPRLVGSVSPVVDVGVADGIEAVDYRPRLASRLVESGCRLRATASVVDVVIAASIVAALEGREKRERM